MRIYLIRHGQTDWNARGKIQGSTDIDLNETGRWQAACLAGGMERRQVGQIFSSRLKRAFETAQTIGDSQGVKVETVEGLREVDFGEWEGLTWKEIEQKYPEEYKLWWENPAGIAPPGGETKEELHRRSAEVVEWILAHAKGDLAVVLHGGIMAYVVEYLMRNSRKDKAIIVENASITTLEYDADSQMVRLVEKNDVSHLGRKSECLNTADKNS